MGVFQHFMSFYQQESLLHCPGFFVEKKMVEQTRQRIQVVSLQAGPGEVNTSILFGLNLRYHHKHIYREKNKRKIKLYSQVQIY